MRIFPALYGNENAKKLLGEAVAERRFGQAYIIEGASGTGRHTLARLTAAAVNCRDAKNGASDELPCGKCASCVKILNGDSVDVTYYNRGERKTIGVDTMREMLTRSSLMPNESDYSVFIVEEAELLYPNAQHALLLSLEDPTPSSLFLLLTEDSSALLETIRSRAPVIRMENLPDDELERAVLATVKTASGLKKRSPERFAGAIAKARGSVGEARLLLGERRMRESGKSDAAALALMKALLNDPDSDGIGIIGSLPVKAEELTPLLERTMLAFRDLIAARRSASPEMLFFAAPEEARETSSGRSTAALIRKFDKLASACADISANVSVPTSLASMFAP